MSLAFLISRYIAGPNHFDLCHRCYQSIRTWYVNAPIIIVDDHSVFPDSHKYDELTVTVRNPFKRSGEMGLFPVAYQFLSTFSGHLVFLQDSTLLQGPIETTGLGDVKFFASFEASISAEVLAPMVEQILGTLNPDHQESLIGLARSGAWVGCFGMMLIVRRTYFDQIVREYNLFDCLPSFKTREERSAGERVLAIVFTHAQKGPVETVLGDIYQYKLNGEPGILKKEFFSR